MKDRGYRIITIIALCISIIGLWLGFSTYTQVLKIERKADVISNDEGPLTKITPTDSSSKNPYTVKPTYSVAKFDEKGKPMIDIHPATAEDAIITVDKNGNTMIENLKVQFHDPGQNFVYKIKTTNISDYVLYLDSIKIGDKTCTIPPNASTSMSLVKSVCKDIILTLKVGNESFTTSNENILDHVLIKESYEIIEIGISYANNGNRADGPLEVNFDDVILSYTTSPKNS